MSCFNSYHWILASASARRKELLQSMNIQFEILPLDINETFPNHLIKEEIPLFISTQKAQSVSSEIIQDKTIIITADTMVFSGDNALGKPANEKEAIDMLLTLSGKKHEVITAVCLRTHDKLIRFFATTEVWFRTLDLQEIHFYINYFAPFDKAGAYGIQEWIGLIGIERIWGSYTNVVGLPTEDLFVEMKKICGSTL